MKMNIKQTLATILTLAILLCSLSACSITSSKKSIVGKWYNNDGKCLDIRSDGSYKLEDSYGTGTWKYLDDDQSIEFTDVYGDTNETIVEKDDTGDYIKFSPHGNFYRRTANLNRNESSPEVASIALTNAGDFSDGVAWISYTDEFGTEQLALINTKGNIIYKEANDWYMNVLPPAIKMSGVSCIKDRNNNYKLINKEGKLCATSQDGVFEKILAFGDGLALVYKYSGPKESKHLYGVINQNGEFVCDFIELYFNPEAMAVYDYKGCGIFSIGKHMGEYALLNSYTGKVVYLSDTAPEFIDDIAFLPQGYRITDEPQSSYHGEIQTYSCISIDTNFNISQVAEFKISTGGMLVERDYGYNEPIHIINPRTNNKFTLDYYTSTELISLEYIDDYGFLTIKASDNNKYFTLLDTQGKELFEPIKFSLYATFSDRKIVYELDGKYSIVDTNGKFLAKNLEYQKINGFNDDIAVAITTYDEYCFINSKGERILQNIHE